MDLRQLRYFAVLAEELHFRRAAERLHITQAPLSLAIQALERELGSKLFQRTRRSVALTETGAALRVDARAILERVEQSRATIRDLTAGTAGQLRIGVTPGSSLLPFFPTLISAFRSERPRVLIVLREMTSKDQLLALEANEIDIGFVRNPPRPAEAGISFTRLMNDPLILAMDRNHRLARRARIKLVELKDEAFISYPRQSGIAIYELVARLCALRGFTQNIVQEVQETTTLIGLAAIGFGVAIVPSGVAFIRVPNIVYKPLHDADATTEIHLACRSGEPGAVVATFRRLAQVVVASSRKIPLSAATREES
jgi:DNA-binding transcriptional LysR family regulator